MSFHAAISTILPTVPLLDDTNWFPWSKKMKMFFTGAGAAQITAGADAAAPSDDKVKAKYNEMDGQLVAFVYTKVSEEYQYLVEDCTTASEAWKTLKAHFEKSTMGHRMAARREFYNITHDPSLPISQYVQAVTTARMKLSAFGCKIEDSEFVDVLLMNLHESYHHIRATILMEATEPALDRIKSMLTGSAAATELVSIKQEPSSPLLAHRAFAQGGKMGRSGGGSGPGQVGVSSTRPGRVDAKGYTWSDTTNSGGCHRCGRAGHIAARCMYNMPEHVKEWIMTSGTRSRSPSPPYNARVAVERAASATTHITPAWYVDEESGGPDLDYELQLVH